MTGRPWPGRSSTSWMPRACRAPARCSRSTGSAGPAAAGDWVPAPSDAPLEAATIHAAVARALEGPSELAARPLRAAVEPGEAAVLRIVLDRPGALAAEAAPAARLTVRDEAGRTVFATEVPLEGTPQSRAGRVPIATRRPLPPGLYRATIELRDAPWSPRSALSGFWVKDAALLASAPSLGVSRDWIRRDGKVLPIAGTTYMASDVHRKFLFEPNPAVWDRDFDAMRRLGINLVRTGLWTGWDRVRLETGAVDENVLSALDAYVLTAARHRIVVCFTFFAFLPPAFGGSNPYLDPASIEAQRAFVTAFARRYRGVGWIHWDLINEPSYARPEDTWKNRPIGDPFERAAWTAWARARHGEDPAVLRELWRDAGADLFDLPRAEEFDPSFLRGGGRPRKVRDFGEFSQDAVAGWARTLRDAIKAAGGDVLVTLGQDEGGADTRPAPSLHADALDYTSVHTWWNNDDLLWDGVVTKSPERPNLHQETGLMSLEDTDGFAWRSPERAADLLERKLAYAFAGRGAGVVQWAWNVNPYQPIDNEATIGLWRPDGTAKPEMDALADVARFLDAAAPYLDDFAADPVVVVIPHSRMFMGRPRALDGTRRVVRLLAERFGVVPTALSELRLTAERLRESRLVIVPTPEILQEGAAAALLAAARAGTRVLVTGAVEGDSYGRTTESLAALGLVDPGRPIALHEPTPWGGVGTVTFEGLAQEKLRRASGPSPVALAGTVWHEPLPLDLARETEPLAALLGAALDRAGVSTHPGTGGVAARLLVAPRAVLAAVVNESPSETARRVDVEGTPVDIPVGPLRARLVLFERGTARVIAATRGDPVLPGVEVREGGIVRGPRRAKRLALLFTGHEFAEGGDVVLDTLARHHARASFFLTGDFLRNPAFAPLVRRIVALGHSLGPHSDRHLLYCAWEDRKTLVTREAFRRDLEDNLREIERFGRPRADVRYWEPAYEWFNPEIARWGAELGLRTLGFTPGTRSNADYTGEADPRFVPSETILRSILDREQADPDGLDGFLLLLHVGAGPGRTDKMHAHLEGLLSALEAKGYRFLRVEEMLGLADGT